MIQGGDGPRRRRFQMRADLLSMGDDYWIQDEDGNKAFHVDGKTARVRETWVLEDANGNDVATIREKKLSIRDKIKIEFSDGKEAVVRKAMIGIGEKYICEVEGGPELKIKGKIGENEYKIERDGDKVAEVSKKWFRVRDTYGVEVEDDAWSALVLCVTVAVGALSAEGEATAE
jgi:uncharacterized protein YxjI